MATTTTAIQGRPGRHLAQVTRLARNHPTAAVSLLFLALAGTVVWRLHGATFDDAFIFYRYAHNLATGHGWAYDPGIRTSDAATGPLYVGALAVFTFAMRDASVAATLLFVGTLSGAAVLLFMILRRLGHPISGIAAGVLLVVDPAIGRTRGMETSTFLLLILVCVFAYLERREVLLGAAVVLCFLARGDGAVLGPILFLGWLVRDRRIPWRAAAAAGAVAAIWVGIALGLGASVLPDTLAAKTAQGASGFWGQATYVHGLASEMGHDLWPWVRILVPLAGVGALRMAGSSQLRRLWPLPAAAVLIFTVYAVAIRPPFYPWYYGPQHLAVVTAAGLALAWPAESRSRLPDRTVGLALTAALAAMAVVGTLVALPQIEDDARLAGYVAAGHWLQTHSPPGSTVASLEIGVLGYNTDRTIVDYLGLLSRRSSQDVARRDTHSWLARERPDYVLVHSPAWLQEQQFIQLPFFRSHYRPCWTAGGWYDPATGGTGGMVLYRRT